MGGGSRHRGRKPGVTGGRARTPGLRQIVDGMTGKERSIAETILGYPPGIIHTKRELLRVYWAKEKLREEGQLSLL